MLTRIDDSHALIVHLIAGDNWEEHLPQAERDLEAFCKLYKIEVIEAYCRKGLVEPLKKSGWKPIQTVMKKTIKGNDDEFRRRRNN